MASRLLPTRISPCPINEAVLEIRYNTSAPSEAIFGMVYSRFRGEFPKFEKLPILQIPEGVRAVDPQLMYLPEYKLLSEDFVLLVGQKSFSVANVGEYKGWGLFRHKALTVFDQIHEMDIIGPVSRLGLRYINVFDEDIFRRSTLRVMHRENELASKSTNIAAQIPAMPFISTLRMANNVPVQRRDRQFIGSVIDIDTALDAEIKEFNRDKESLIDQAHEGEKTLFFGLLTDKFLSELNPEYGEVK